MILNNLQSRNALTAIADAAVGNLLQWVLFITNNKGIKPALLKKLLVDIVHYSLYPREEYNASFKLLNQHLHETARKQKEGKAMKNDYITMPVLFVKVTPLSKIYRIIFVLSVIINLHTRLWLQLAYLRQTH